MKLTSKDIIELRRALEACKVIEVDGVVIHEGMIRGAKPSLDAAIISPLKLSIGEDARLGIGRVKELDKRLAIFGDDAEIECKVGNTGDISLLTIGSGRTKMQFRCTSPGLIRYPKSNDDPLLAEVTLTKNEAQQVVRAIKTLSSETVVLHASRAGMVRVECADSSNDKFEIELSNTAKYSDDEGSFVQTYLSGLFVGVIEQASRDLEETTLLIGEGGSLTAQVRGHTVIIFPQITGDE